MHINGLSPQDYRKLDSRCRQKRYLETLQGFNKEARQYFLKIFDTLAQTKGVNSETRILLESGIGYHGAYGLATELVELIEQMVLTRAQQNFPSFHALRAVLDDMNVAVNAWVNRQCLHHSSHNVQAYSQLRQQALRPSLN